MRQGKRTCFLGTEELCVLDRPDASFDPHVTGEEMHTQLSDSWFREVHRSKIGLHCPRLDLLEAVPHIGLDLQSGAHADRDAGTAFANGDQGSCDVLGLKRLLSLNVARVDMQNTRPCCKDALRILGQFLWRNGECRMFARSPTPIEASLQEHVGVPFLSSSFLL